MFTDSEIEAAVQSLVQTQVSGAYTSGVRNLAADYSDLRSAAASTFLLYPTALPYVLHLSARRLEEILQSAASVLDEMLSGISLLQRPLPAVKDLTPLTQASSALRALEQAISKRKLPFDTAPAPFVDLASQIDQFATAQGGAIKDSGQIVQTPPEIRKALPAKLEELKDLYAELLRRARLTQGASSALASVNLPALSAGAVLKNARTLLGAHQAELEGLSEEERLEKIHQVLLDLFAIKATTKAFLGLSTVSLAVAGTLTPYSDSVHPALPAVLPADVGPYSITSSNRALNLTLNGSEAVNLLLPLSPIATLDGTQAEPFDTTTNPTFRFYLDGSLTTVTLPTSSTLSAEAVCSAINGLSPGLAAPYFSPLRYEGLVQVAPLLSHQARFTLIAGSFAGLGITVGHLVWVTAGPNTGLWTVTHVTSTYLDATSGIDATTETRSIQVGPPNRKVRLKVSGAPEDRTVLQIDPSDSNTASDLLGFFKGIQSESRPSTAKELALAINSQTLSVVASTELVETFTATFEGSLSDSTTVTTTDSFTAEYGDLFRVLSGPNAGDYYVLALSSGLLSLQTALLLPRRGLAVQTFEAVLGQERLVLTSKDETTLSQVSAAGSATDVLFPTEPTSAYGTTPWVQLPLPKPVQQGDYVDFHQDDYKTPTSSSKIFSIDRSLSILELSPPIPSDTSWTLGETPPPFARLRSAQGSSTSTLVSALETWLDQQESSYFIQLDALLNPLFLSRNPTDLQVALAKEKLLDLGKFLTGALASLAGSTLPTLEGILVAYQAPVCPPVQDLIRIYQRKGLDRSVDLLTEADLKTFLGVSAEEASYAGNLLSSIREVGLNDLPTRKTDRLDARRSRILGVAGTDDPEFDKSK